MRNETAIALAGAIVSVITPLVFPQIPGLVGAALYGVAATLTLYAFREKLQPLLPKRWRATALPGANEGEIPIWKAVEHVRAVIGDNDVDKCYEETRHQLRQRAIEDKIHFRGRRELEPPHKPGYPTRAVTGIDPSYWEKNELNQMATGCVYEESEHTRAEPLVIDGYRNRYWSLVVMRAEIEACWQPSANIGFDITFHHLILYVAIKSKWAGSFVPNDSSDWMVRMRNDPWDALKRQICGPLTEGTLKARGIRKGHGQPKENSLSDVPSDFWKAAQFDVKNLLLSRKANGASGEGGAFLGVIFRGDEIDRIWPGRSEDEIRDKPSAFVQLAKDLPRGPWYEETWDELAVRDGSD